MSKKSGRPSRSNKTIKRSDFIKYVRRIEYMLQQMQHAIEQNIYITKKANWDLSCLFNYMAKKNIFDRDNYAAYERKYERNKKLAEEISKDETLSLAEKIQKARENDIPQSWISNDTEVFKGK